MTKPPKRSRPASGSQPRPIGAEIGVGPHSVPPTISGKWLLGGLALALLAAVLCAWGTLCILFWQGSWQLLYHPTSAVNKTPATANLRFESIGFDTNSAGEPQLRGWWIPATTQSHYTAIYLHGQTGNLADTIPSLDSLHSAGLNIFSFDYRGYGQSHFEHPSEKRWREDAESALKYLSETRHVPTASIILIGRDLGANLALEVAAAHPDLLGVVLDNPLENPTSAIFSDARAHLVPARLLVSDRWDSTTAAANLLIPSLWIYRTGANQGSVLQNQATKAYQAVQARKTVVWLTNSPQVPQQFSNALSAFLDQLGESHEK